jgi:hypothetical protein
VRLAPTTLRPLFVLVLLSALLAVWNVPRLGGRDWATAVGIVIVAVLLVLDLETMWKSESADPDKADAIDASIYILLLMLMFLLLASFVLEGLNNLH